MSVRSRNLVARVMKRGLGIALTGVVFYADAFDPIRHIGQARQTCDKPAVAKVALLDVAREDVFHKSRLLEDFVYALDGFGDVCRGIYQIRRSDGEPARPQAVQAIALFPFEVPVL